MGSKTSTAAFRVFSDYVDFFMNCFQKHCVFASTFAAAVLLLLQLLVIVCCHNNDSCLLQFFRVLHKYQSKQMFLGFYLIFNLLILESQR